jgi:hypothetical protein
MNKIFNRVKNNVLLNTSSYKYFCFLFVLFVSCSSSYSVSQQSGKKIAPPESGIYVGAFPDMGGTEDSVTYARLKAFENLTGQMPVWVYFSNNWFGSIKFPKKEVKIIKEFGSIPFIRLMPRSDYLENKSDPIYSLQKIIDGKFDKALKTWATDAKKYGEPLMVEFGTEVNGNWFPWSGVHNGKNPEKFKDAYIHIIELFRDEDVNNITWVFHVNYDSSPDEKWNTMSAYYPGDEYIDWIGMSIYGAQNKDDEWTNITDVFEEAYKNLSSISKNKPLAVFEFGVVEHEKKPEWIKAFFELIKSEKYSRIKGISYWHSRWENEDGSYSNMRLDSSPEALKVYQDAISDKFFMTKIKLH